MPPRRPADAGDDSDPERGGGASKRRRIALACSTCRCRKSRVRSSPSAAYTHLLTSHRKRRSATASGPSAPAARLSDLSAVTCSHPRRPTSSSARSTFRTSSPASNESRPGSLLPKMGARSALQAAWPPCRPLSRSTISNNERIQKLWHLIHA